MSIHPDTFLDSTYLEILVSDYFAIFSFSRILISVYFPFLVFLINIQNRMFTNNVGKVVSLQFLDNLIG